MIVSSVCHASSGKDLIAQSSKEELLVLSQTGNKPPHWIQQSSEPSAVRSRGKHGFCSTFSIAKITLISVFGAFIRQNLPSSKGRVCLHSWSPGALLKGLCHVSVWNGRHWDELGLSSSVSAVRPAGWRSQVIFTDLLMLESLRNSLHTYMELSLSHFYKYFRKTEDSLFLKKKKKTPCSFSCDSLNQGCPIIQGCSLISRADLFLPLLFIFV